jgi:hypothetical protein
LCESLVDLATSGLEERALDGSLDIALVLFLSHVSLGIPLWSQDWRHLKKVREEKKVSQSFAPLRVDILEGKGSRERNISPG